MQGVGTVARPWLPQWEADAGGCWGLLGARRAWPVHTAPRGAVTAFPTARGELCEFLFRGHQTAVTLQCGRR